MNPKRIVEELKELERRVLENDGTMVEHLILRAMNSRLPFLSLKVAKQWHLRIERLRETAHTRVKLSASDIKAKAFEPLDALARRLGAPPVSRMVTAVCIDEQALDVDPQTFSDRALAQAARRKKRAPLSAEHKKAISEGRQKTLGKVKLTPKIGQNKG